MISKGKKTILIAILVLAAILVLKATNMGEALTLSNIQQKADNLRKIVEDNYMVAIGLFAISYILTNLFLPVATIFTLLGGFLFGTLAGAAYVSASATCGAVIGFWISRIFAGHWFQDKWQEQLKGFNHRFSQYGYIYLILIRMVPMMPYALINFLAGLTKIKTLTFAWTTAVGSLPGILIFSYAGRSLLRINSIEDILTGKVIAAFLLMTAFTGGIIAVKATLDKKNGMLA
jgi:uncharacterized membrane protein YdjX (TVP38/TMEM64 family)